MENINDMDKNKCTGCMACSQVCPVKAITCSQDEEGFYIPLIDAHKCVGCGRCFQRCPVNNDYLQEPPVDSSYIAQLKNSKLSKKSASGGAFIGIANWFLDKYKDGVVAGAAIGDDLVVRHYAVNDVGKLYKLQNTKYVQSCTDGIFSEIKGYLDSGRHVLFSGTPCQIAALYAILDDSEKEKIITVDLVCHGVPPIKYFKDYLKYLKIQNKIDNVTFRGENNRHFTAYKKEKIVYKRHSKEDVYYSAFLEGLFYRENCYQCRYAKKERVSDITIGDFWGLGDEIPFNHKIEDGVSLILVNTKKRYIKFMLLLMGFNLIDFTLDTEQKLKSLEIIDNKLSVFFSSKPDVVQNEFKGYSTDIIEELRSVALISKGAQIIERLKNRMQILSYYVENIQEREKTSNITII